MAYKHSKGWYISQLKEKGITKHLIDRKSLNYTKRIFYGNYIIVQ